jgi:hypothetical protein
MKEIRQLILLAGNCITQITLTVAGEILQPFFLLAFQHFGLQVNKLQNEFLTQNFQPKFPSSQKMVFYIYL